MYVYLLQAYVYDIRQLAPVDKLVCKTSVVSTVQYHPSRPLVCKHLKYM